MKKNILWLVIVFFIVCTTSTASAKVVGIVLDIVKDEITITCESKAPIDDVIKSNTTTWIRVNGDLLTVGAKGYKVKGSGVKTFKIDYDLKAGDLFHILSYDSFEKKCAEDGFTITRNIHTIYY